MMIIQTLVTMIVPNIGADMQVRARLLSQCLSA